MLDVILKISQIAAAGAAIFMLYQSVKPKPLCDRCKHLICKRTDDYFKYVCGAGFLKELYHKAPEICAHFEEMETENEEKDYH